MFPVARRTRQRSEADITPRKIVNRNLKNFPVLKKIEKNSKNDLQKQKSMIYYVSVARRMRRSSEADITLKNFADRNLKNFRF